MTNTLNLYEMAAMAEACYVHFEGVYGSLGGKSLKDILIDNSAMTESQASDFVSNWELVSYRPNTYFGFSGTLFRNTNTGEFVFATRGTEPDSPFLDLLQTDLGDIVTDGLAIKQIIEMYNEYSRLRADEGQPYQVAYLGHRGQHRGQVLQ